jgi:hypothetical protein
VRHARTPEKLENSREALMIISHAHRFAFISTMKCATNSLTHVLMTRYGGVMPGGLHDRRMELVPPGAFTFSVCRNPYTRAVSIWWSTCMRHDLDRYGFRRACPDPDSFEGFMAWAVAQEAAPHELLITQSEWHRDTRIDRFLRLEQLDDEFGQLPFVAPGERLALLNATTTADQGLLDVTHLKAGDVVQALGARPQQRRAHVRTYLTPRAVDLVQAWAADDFARFGYALDPNEAEDEPGQTLST